MKHSSDAEDAARWRYVRDNLTQMRQPKMDGQHSWFFRTIRTSGPTIDAALDRLMRDEPDGRISKMMATVDNIAASVI